MIQKPLHTAHRHRLKRRRLGIHARIFQPRTFILDIRRRIGQGTAGHGKTRHAGNDIQRSQPHPACPIIPLHRINGALCHIQQIFPRVQFPALFVHLGIRRRRLCGRQLCCAAKKPLGQSKTALPILHGTNPFGKVFDQHLLHQLLRMIRQGTIEPRRRLILFDLRAKALRRHLVAFLESPATAQDVQGLREFPGSIAFQQVPDRPAQGFQHFLHSAFLSGGNRILFTHPGQLLHFLLDHLPHHAALPRAHSLNQRSQLAGVNLCIIALHLPRQFAVNRIRCRL